MVPKIVRICVNCADKFTPKTGNQRHCSSDCKRERRRISGKDSCDCGRLKVKRALRCSNCKREEIKERRNKKCFECNNTVTVTTLGLCNRHANRFYKDGRTNRGCCYCGEEISYQPTGGIPVCDVCRSVTPASYRRALRYYGLTPRQYIELFHSQGSVCAICKKNRKKMVVDHDHNTGIVRGILCDPCNKCLRDDIWFHQEAIRYLSGATSVKSKM